MLGVTVTPIEEWHRSIYALGDVQGVFVAQVTPGSPADKAGIKVGDVLQLIEGETITMPSQVAAKVQSQREGTSLTVRIVRGGQPYDVKTVARFPQMVADGSSPDGSAFGAPRAANAYPPSASETALRDQVKKLEDQVKDLEAKLKRSETLNGHLEDRLKKFESGGSSSELKRADPPPTKRDEFRDETGGKKQIPPPAAKSGSKGLTEELIPPGALKKQ
jgi:membrane-associated protease RseP (regulator of RpoE activity)